MTTELHQPSYYKANVSGILRCCWCFCLKFLTPGFTHQQFALLVTCCKLKRTELIAISYLEHLQRPKMLYNMPEWLILIKYPIYPYRHIFVDLYSGCTVTASEKTKWRNGKKYAAAMNK